MIIYKITCKINNKIYIGQTSESLKTRFKRHMGYQKDDNDTKFYRAVRKYGVENFYIEKIDEFGNKNLIQTDSETNRILEEKYFSMERDFDEYE